MNASFDQFRSLRHQVARLGQTRPDLVFVASISSQVTTASFTATHVRMLNTLVKRAHATPNLGLHMHPLDLRSLRVVAFADASFSNNEDCSTQLGYLIVLTDDSARDSPIYYSSYKSHRVERSVFGGELYALADVVDLEVILRQDLKAALSRDVPVVVLNDSFSLFNVVIRTSTITTEKRLMIDIVAMREAYYAREISEIGCIRSGDNFADALTKLK